MTLTRPWHWGIVIMGDPKAEVPTTLDANGVAVGRNVVVVSVRHAQDIGGDRFEGEWDWATATLQLRSLVEPRTEARTQICDTVLTTANETVAVGDADGMVSVPSPSTRTRLVVSVSEVDPAGVHDVWVDLIAVD